MNGITGDLRNTNRSISAEEIHEQEINLQGYPVNMQQYPKSIYAGPYGHSYGYHNNQQNVLLPGQLHSSATIPSSSSNDQNVQMHANNHMLPEGVKQTQETQITGFNQSGLLNSGKMINQVMHQVLKKSPTHNQNHGIMKKVHPIQQTQQPLGRILSPGTNNQNSQRLLHQNRPYQNSCYTQQQDDTLHQRQLIEQMQKQQKSSADLPNLPTISKPQYFDLTKRNDQAISNYQSHQQNRQSISRSQIDLPSTSGQLGHNLRISSQEIYFYQNQNRTNRVEMHSAYSKDENIKENRSELQTWNSKKGIEKALSQPQLSYDEERNDNTNSEFRCKEIKNQTSESAECKNNYEISVEHTQSEQVEQNCSIVPKRTDKEEDRSQNSYNIRLNESRLFSRRKSQNDEMTVNQELTEGLIQKRIEELCKRNEIKSCQNLRSTANNNIKVENQIQDKTHQDSEIGKNLTTEIKESGIIKQEHSSSHNMTHKETEYFENVDGEQNIEKFKIQYQGSGSDYDKPGQSSSNIDSGRGSAAYSSGRKLCPEDSSHTQGQDAEWVDIVETELRNILEPKDIAPVMHSTLSDSISSVTPPLPPLTPEESPRDSRKRYSKRLCYEIKPSYRDCNENMDKKSYTDNSKYRNLFSSRNESKKFSQRIETGDITSTTTGLDLDSMLDRSDSDLSTNDARTIRKQLEGLENMYSEVLKLLGSSSMKRKRKAHGLASYGSVSSLPTSSVSSRPIARHDKRRPHTMDDRMKKAKDLKSINKRFQRLESHVVTLARSVAHLSSEMRTQHLMIQEMENIRSEITALRTQTNMAIVRSQSQPVIKDSELPVLSNPSRVKKLTKFFGTEPPLIRLFLRELGYEKYAGAFEKEKVGMIELPYLSEERLQKMGIPLGPRLRILQEARISVCMDSVYVV